VTDRQMNGQLSTRYIYIYIFHDKSLLTILYKFTRFMHKHNIWGNCYRTNLQLLLFA